MLGIGALGQLALTQFPPPPVLGERVTGGWLPTREEIELARKYWRDLEKGTKKRRRERDELQRKVTETAKKAYDHALGIEPEAAAEIVAAVAEVAPEAVRPAPKASRKATASAAPPLQRLDWRAVAKSVEAIGRILAVLEAQDMARRAEVAARFKAYQDELDDEEDIEILLLAS